MERRTQKTKPGPSGESLIKMWGTVIKTLGCVIDRVATEWTAIGMPVSQPLFGHGHPLECLRLSPSLS